MKYLPGLILLMLPVLAAAEVVVPIDSVENHVNIRMSADSTSEVVGRLNQGEFLPLVASVGEWHEVEITGGATGFISADWTVVLASPPVIESTDDTGVVENVGEEISAGTAETAAAPTAETTSPPWPRDATACWTGVRSGNRRPKRHSGDAAATRPAACVRSQVRAPHRRPGTSTTATSPFAFRDCVHGRLSPSEMRRPVELGPQLDECGGTLAAEPRWLLP